MRKQIMTTYQLNGVDMVESTTWNKVGAGNPKAVPLPGEEGVWMITKLSNGARDTSGLSVPSEETFEQVMVDENGNQSVVNVPVSVDMDQAYWDYYNLPLKPGVVLV